MNFIKKYKLQMILFTLLSILVGVVLLIFFMFIYHTDSNSRYGNRLDGIENVRIDTNYFEAMKSELLEFEEVADFSSSISGRIINVIVTFEEGVTITRALEFEDTILIQFDEDILEFYDIQFFVRSLDEENENFPAIGYKHHSNDSFIWTNNIEL